MVADIPWGTFVAEGIHIRAGILWFGAALCNALILIPSLNPLPIDMQRTVATALGDGLPDHLHVHGAVAVHLTSAACRAAW